MKTRASLYKKLILPGLAVLTCFAFTSLAPVERISMKMVSKSLQNGKSITTKADIYYRISEGLLVTYITSPVECLVTTNDKGEFKLYDFKTNTVSQKQASDFSSENSFVHDFLRGTTSDMGLAKSGFHMKNSKIDGNMVVTEWDSPAGVNSVISRIELVHENYSPIYMAFFGKKDKPLSKIYYSNYKRTENINMPLTITEFQYHPNGDSTITKRTYSDIQMNEQVDEKWLNFKIPANATITR